MTYAIEFPDFDAATDAQALIAAGFTDTSWRNDACPSFTREGMCVFVDYLDASRREFAECPRIVVKTDDLDSVVLVEGDDLAQALALVGVTL
jgi:hypothetical protein